MRNDMNNIINEIKKDIWYSRLYKQTNDINTCKRAGYIIEKDIDKEFYDYNNRKIFHCTPINKIMKRYEECKDNGKPKIVLVSTGSYAPLHIGHVNSITLAKKEAEKNGFDVLGCYMSPSHDNYVLKKYSEGKKFNIYERIEIMNQILLDHPFIDVSVWEGLYCKDAVNFTTVLEYIWNAVLNHIPKPNEISMGYVIGSDNVEFSKVFMSDFTPPEPTLENMYDPLPCPAYCFVIERQGYDYSLLDYTSDKVFHIKTNLTEDISSTKIRKSYQDKETQTHGYKKYLIRIGNKNNVYFNDESFNEYFLSRLDWFKNELIKILSSGLPVGVSIETVSVTDQEKEYQELKKRYDKDIPSISLDSCIDGDYNLPLSRLFELSGYQNKPIGFIQQPLRKPTNDIVVRMIQTLMHHWTPDCSHIPVGNYWCFDDDIASGATKKFVTDFLSKNGINVIDFVGLTHVTGNLLDIVDLRDFVVGSNNGGLCVEYKNRDERHIIRVPYVSPFVSLVSRASILPEHENNVSKKVLELNLKLFQDYNKSMYIGSNLAIISGHHFMDTVIDFIEYHIKKLNIRD